MPKKSHTTTTTFNRVDLVADCLTFMSRYIHAIRSTNIEKWEIRRREYFRTYLAV